jgi:hypothetical protein
MEWFVGSDSPLCHRVEYCNIWFLWWFLPKGVEDFYDEITDLENNKKTIVKETVPFTDNWHHLVLREESIVPIRMMMLYLAEVRDTEQEQPFFHYQLALSLLARSDPPLRFYVNAYVEFFRAFKVALYVNKEWDGTEDIKAAAQKAILGGADTIDGLDDDLQLALDIEQAKRLDEIDSKHVIKMKNLCDLYFLVRVGKRFGKIKDTADLLKGVS